MAGLENNDKILKNQLNYKIPQSDFKNLKIQNKIISSKRKYKKKGSYVLSGLQENYYNKKIMRIQSIRVKDFWENKTNTYPFIFKQTKVLKENNQDKVILVLEKHQYDYKRVTPNLISKKKKCFSD